MKKPKSVFMLVQFLISIVTFVRNSNKKMKAKGVVPFQLLGDRTFLGSTQLAPLYIGGNNRNRLCPGPAIGQNGDNSASGTFFIFQSDRINF